MKSAFANPTTPSFVVGVRASKSVAASVFPPAAFVRAQRCCVVVFCSGFVLLAAVLTGCSTHAPALSEKPWNQPTRTELKQDVKFWWSSPEWAGFEWDPIRNTPVHWP